MFTTDMAIIHAMQTLFSPFCHVRDLLIHFVYPAGLGKLVDRIFCNAMDFHYVAYVCAVIEFRFRNGVELVEKIVSLRDLKTLVECVIYLQV